MWANVDGAEGFAAMSGSSQPAGWYPAEGDPPGTVRWWDGTQWVGGPQTQGIQQQAGYVAPGGNVLPNGREIADPWLRIAAQIIDGILVFIVGAIFGGASAAFSVLNGEDGADGLGVTDVTVGLPVFIGTLVIVLYHTLMNTYMSGGLGKQILGLRIVRADGTEPLGTPDGIKRSANQIADLLIIIPILGPILLFIGQSILNLVSLVFLFSDPEHRTVMDRFANTYVVKKQ